MDSPPSDDAAWAGREFTVTPPAIVLEPADEVPAAACAAEPASDD